MRWLHWTVDEFEVLHNPNNCAIIVLERVDGAADGAAGEGSEKVRHPMYRLTRHSRELLNSPSSGGIGRALKLGQVLARDERQRFRGGSARDADAGWDFGGSTSWGL